MLKKVIALVIALAMVLVMSTAALAVDLGGTEDGVAGTWAAKDTEIVQDKTINIKKELISFNATSTSVHAPAFTYVYTVTPADVSNLTVTDEEGDDGDHKSGAAVVAPVQAGKTAKLKVNNGTEGTAESAVGTLVFANTNTLTTSADGTANEYDITLDFSGVAFTQPGVYRYQIAETLADSKTYAGIDVEDGGTNTLYLDVYVDGDLAIYGYVCMAANASVTPDTEKTNGFVTASNGADKYYTYDLTLSKNVENDSYAESNVAFPFTVIFNNSDSFTTTYTIEETAGTGSTGISPAAASAPEWSGVAKVKEGGAITYTGIPAGVDVDVYETNPVTGVTYEVQTVVNDGTPVTDSSVTWGSEPASAVAQAASKNEYESTKATVDTTAVTKITTDQTVAITNSLLLISPTGVVLRIAPYVMILCAGIALLLISRRRKAAVEE